MRLLLFFLLVAPAALAQQGWTWTELAPMPEPVANHAVEAGWCGDTLCVFSFAGIDTTKSYTGIHLDTYRYNTLTDAWSTLTDVPDTLGKIAAGASTIQGKIYVAGGYYVFANGSELSSDDLHVFDPETSSWLEDAAPMPTPIDDQVQTVYRDSLLVLATGWSDTGNVNDIQLFDVTTQTWQSASEPPSSTLYTAFGASGAIVGDTLYYLGGVSNTFSANSALRRGDINPEDATDIDWSFSGTSPTVDDTYRAACSTYQDQIVWFGGAGIAYNYDGLAYAGGDGVPPLDRILTYHPASDTWNEILGTPEAVMDLRGVAKVAENQWIICGGMHADQTVSDRTFLLTFDPANHIETIAAPMPWTWVRTEAGVSVSAEMPVEVTVLDVTGRLLHTERAQQVQWPAGTWPIGSFLRLEAAGRVEVVRL